MSRDGNMPSSFSWDLSDSVGNPERAGPPGPRAARDDESDRFNEVGGDNAPRGAGYIGTFDTGSTSVVPLDPPPSVPLPPDDSAPPVSSSGRHARRDGSQAVPSLRGPRIDSYVPRHSIDMAGPDAVSASDVTEVFSRVREDPMEPPRLSRPESSQQMEALDYDFDDEDEDDDDDDRRAVLVAAMPEPEPLTQTGKRVRVVLSQRKSQARPVRTVVDVQELTEVGQMLASSLIRSQLSLALRIGGIAVLALGVLPTAFYLAPDLGRFELFGLRLPWLLLGVVAYPFMLLLGWLYSRSAEKLEQIFADHIQN